MRVVVPITGELIASHSGNPDNPVRPLNLSRLLPEPLCHFDSRNFNYDFDRGLVEFEVTFRPRGIPIKWDAQGKVEETRPETENEFEGRKIASENALRNVLRTHTIDELHQMTKEPKLIKPRKIAQSSGD